jgi:hypothetical protein
MASLTKPLQVTHVERIATIADWFDVVNHC